MNLGCGIFNINNDESVDTLYENIEDTLTEAVGEMYDGISLKPNALDIFEKKLKHLIEEAYFKPDPQHKTEGILVDAVTEALSELAPSHKRLPDNIFNMYCLGDASGLNILNLLQKSSNILETTNESSKHDELDKTALEKYEEETDKMPFLTAGYRTSLGAQHRMETTMFHGLMRSFFVGDEAMVQTFEDVNNNIRKFYEDLYNLILDFIKYKKPDADFTGIEHLYKIEHGKPVYHRAFEIIQERFSDILKAIRPRLSIDESSGYPTVRDLDNWEDNYAKAKSDLQERCKKSLDAYNAMFILTHHDDLVHKFFSKVDIAKGMPNKWNSFDLTGIIGHKYQFGTMSNSLTTWHDDDKDFSAAELMDDETKGIVNTTKYKLYGENVLSMGKYITLADFNRIVTKLKKIAYLDSGTTPITGALAETIKSIYGKSYPNLRSLIGELNSDAPVNFRNLFILLSKDSFWQAYPKFQDLDLEAEDKNLIWSIYKGLFEDEPSNWKPGDDLSLFAKWMRDPNLNNKNNYYNFIAQACASIEALTLQQFKRDSDGLITNQTLRDNVNSGISSRIERAITGALDPNSLNDFIGRFKLFTPKELKEGQIDNYWKNFGFKNVAYYKDLTLQVGNFIITMNSNSDTVHIYKNGLSYMGKLNVDGTASKNLTFSKEDLMELLPFIQRVLPTFKIENIDSPLIEALRRRESSSGQAYDTATRKLIKLAAGVYKLAAIEQYIKSKYNRQGSISELDYRNSLSDFFDKDHMPRIDLTIANGALSSLISKGNLITFKDIATALQIVEGVYGDNTTRDSEGKLISLIGMSMLVTKIELQVYTLNLKPNSATKHFALWEGGFYKGAQFTREFAGVEDSTIATKFNVNEHFQALFVYDYIHGILPKEDAYDHRYVGMMPSVLSDKSRILKILTDFHADNTFGFKDSEGHTLKWKDLNAKQWEQIANIELGTYYYNIWNNTVDVFNKLNAFVQTDASPYKKVVFDPYNNFLSFNLWCLTTGNNAGEVLRVMAREYNKRNPKDIIEITDQIHYVNTVDKNNNSIIAVNRGIISMLSRFSNNGELTLSTKGIDRSAILTDFANYVNRIHGEEFIKLAVNTRTGEKYELGSGNIVAGYNTKFAEKSSEEFNKDLASYIANTHKYIPIEAFIKTTDSGLQVLEAENINVDLGSFLNIKSFGFTPVTNEQFWQQKKSMLVRNLLNNGATISTINPTTSEPLDLPELKLLKGENNEWLHESGDIAFARVKVRNENGEEYWIKLASLANASHLNYTIKGTEKTIYFSNNEFNFYDMKNNSDKYIDFELNPYLETFNAANYVISQEYMNSSVGTHLNHPSKKFSKGKMIDDLEEESERWLAQVKRNVSLSATKHSFALGLLNGIRSNYRIAVIRDDKAPTYNVFGQFDKGGAKPFDGSTLVCGTNNYLENNSLAGARAGDVKKQFVHSYKEETGSGIIIKTAGFPITNALIANSDFYRRMNKKMMKGIWTESDGETPFIPDITKNYFGDDIVYEPIFFKRQEADGTWTKWEVKRIEAIRDAKGNLTGEYKRYIKRVNNDGTDFNRNTDPISEIFSADGLTVVNSNYMLWQLFGGENALEIDPETNTLKDSESSFINVVQAMNSISEQTFDKKHPPLSQSQVHLNLKFSNIDYVVTEGAIKQGAANINDTRAYFEDNYELATMEVSMHDSGILLDAEHHADESTLSIMTQVVNALCARGYTLTDASEAYQAMCALTEHGIVDYMEGLEDMFTTNDGTSLRNAVAKTVVKGLARLSDREGSLVEAVAETIIAEANSGKKITYKELKDKVPFSHPAIFNSLVSMISSALTKQGIKIKFPGSLAVLNPSNRIWQFHGDHWTKRDLVGDKGMDLLKLQAKYDKQFLNTAQIIPGHYYKVLDTSGKAVDMRQLNLGKSSNGKPKTGVDYIFVETPKELWKFKDWLAKNPGYNLVENVTEARDLAAYNAIFEGEVLEIDPVTGANKTIRKAYSIWDLDIIKALYKIEDDIPSILKKVPKVEKYDTIEDWQDAMKSYIIKKTPDLIQQFISKDLVLNEDGTFSIDQHWDYDTFRDFENIVIHQFIESNPVLAQLNFENATYKELRKLARRELQRTLGAISTGKAKTAIIDGQTVTIDKSKLHIDPYELIMPKIYATKFGLQAGDSLADIMEKGSDFFLERTLKNWATKTSEDNFDIELKHSNGKHVYIIQRELTETITDEEDPKYGLTFITLLGRKRGHEFDESSNKPTALEKDKNLFFRSEGNQTFRTDGAGNKIHNVYDMNDEIYVDNNGNEIIVTDNAQFYINEGHFDSIRFSDSVLNRGALETETRARTYMDILLDMKDNVKVLEYIDLLGNNKEWYANALDMNTYHRAEKLKDYNAEKLKQLRGKVEMPKAFKFIIDNSIEKFESFKQSLNILAARIPAQSMLSFMPMKVVGFDDSGVNNAYVNYFQFWLLGSDLDIDKVSLLGYAFTNNGTFVKWSPYFRMGTENSMNASKELPFPTGKKVYTKASSDPVELKAWKIVEKHPDLFFKPEGSNEWFLTKKLDANLLIALGQLIRAVNKQGDDKLEILYFPEGQEELAKAIANAVQGHNLYLDRSHDAQKAIMNFITNKMLKVSTNPINLIQSMSSVDDLTEYIKDIANTAESAKRANFFAPGNVEDKMETLILTLTGKENTGIVASAMKTYEALSFYYNNRLATSLENLETLAGIDEDFLEIYYQDVNAIRDKIDFLKSLRTASKDEIKLKIHRLLIPNKVICGLSVSMLSNTYTDKTLLLLNAIDEEELYNAIQAVDNDSDAFLLVSALLSLSTDNAKDPTLAKINAGPDMMGLYTAGVGLGIEFESLAKTMMSASGNMINTLLGGNIFNGQSANRLSDVIKYIDEGPDIEVAPGNALKYLSIALKSLLDNPDADAQTLWESEAAIYNSFDSLAAMDSGVLKATLLKLVNKSDAKTLVKAFRLAIEGTLKSYKELRELRLKIEDEEAKFEDLDLDVEEALLVEHNKRLKELKESIPDYDKLTTATAERRYLSKMMLKWLDYTLKKRISLSNYLTVGSGDTVNLWDNKKHKLRTADWECMYPGDAYLKGGLAIPFVAWAKEPTKDEIETYKEQLAKWKETTWQVFKDKWKAESDRQWEAYNAEVEALHKDGDRRKRLKNKRPDVYHSEEYLKERDALLLTRPSLFKYIDRNGVELDRRIFGKGIPVYNAYDSIRKLNDVNNEMGKLRDRLKLNQGLPNNLADLFAAIRSFNKLMQDQFSVYKKSLPVINGKKMKVPDDVASAVEEFDVLDLNRFILDELYRNRAIETYDKIKTAFNVLDAVWEVPHYRGYLKALNALFEGERINSARYRLSHQLGNSVLTAEEDGDLAMSGGSKEITRIYSQAGKFVLYKMNNMFLQLSNMTIGLNPGQQFIDKNGRILIALGRTSIQLGTPQGNASFRLWFELVCVPNMQRRFFGRYKEINGKVTDIEDNSTFANKFIRDLAKEKNTRTISGNATYAYTLPISMLARSESEQREFNVYKNAFNSLNKNRYYFLTIDDSGKVIQYGIPVLDLFFAYNLIVYGGESNLNSFSTIFEDLLRNKTLPILEDYNKFVSGFDENGELIEGEDYTRNELLSWLAPRVYNAKAAKAPYIRIYDPDTMRIILAERGTEINAAKQNPDTGEVFTDILTGSYYTKIDTDNNMQYNHNYVIDLPNGNRILRLNSTDYAEVINGNLTRVKRNGKTYTTLQLLDFYNNNLSKMLDKKYKDAQVREEEFSKRKVSTEDFTVIEEVFAEGNSNITRPSRTYIDTLLQEIFNPICE